VHILEKRGREKRRKTHRNRLRQAATTLSQGLRANNNISLSLSLSASSLSFHVFFSFAWLFFCRLDPQIKYTLEDLFDDEKIYWQRARVGVEGESEKMRLL
jgi:hypothetical protein